MTTNTNAAPTVSSDVQEQLDFNEYQLECAADGTKAKTFHQWKNQGNIATPALIATATGNTPVKVATNETVPKSLIARQVFARHAATGSLVRKSIISDFISEAFLTPAGAATYYANIGAAYKKAPQAFMDANYVVPVLEALHDVELEQIEEEVASLLATDAVEEEPTDEFDTLAANDEEVEDAA
jgi:hypothetical protein